MPFSNKVKKAHVKVMNNPLKILNINLGAAPSKFNIAAKAKYDFWRKLGDMSKEEAMKGYVNLVSELYPGWEKYYNETNEPKPKL